MAESGRRVRIFSALEVANICGVVNQTAINWIRNGHLKAFTTPGGQYRIYAKDLAAFLDKRGMSASGEVLQVIIENANWDTFLIAAEQSENDNLKNQLGNLLTNYTVIQAYDWFEIGMKFSGEKPGFVLLDADLPGGDVSKFIHTVREDPSFGKPFIFLLTSGNTAGVNGVSSASSASEGSASIQSDFIFTKPLDLNKLEVTMKILERQIDVAASA